MLTMKAIAMDMSKVEKMAVEVIVMVMVMMIPTITTIIMKRCIVKDTKVAMTTDIPRDRQNMKMKKMRKTAIIKH